MAKEKVSIKDQVKEPVSEAPAKSSLGKDEIEITHPDQLNKIQDENKLSGFSGWFFSKGVDAEGNEIRVPSVNDKGEYVFIKGAKAICKVALSILLVIGLFSGNSFAAPLTTDESVLGNDRWSVQNDGDIIPHEDSSYDIGASGAEVDNIYADSVWVGGAEYTSFAAGTDGNWTDQGLTVTLDRAPTLFVATVSSGDFAATGFTVGTGDITGANGAKIDLDTANEVRLIENSDTFKIGFSADDITFDSTDGGIRMIFTDATDGTLDVCANNDSDDCLIFQTASNVPNITTNGSANLKITADGGTIDFDNENLTTTGTASIGATTVTSLIIGDETFSVPSDDTIRIASNDAATIWEVYTPATSNEDACLKLTADASGDNGDEWQVCSDGGTNSLIFQNDTSGSMVTKFTIPTSGSITFGDDITLENGEFIQNDTTDDTVRISSDDASLIFSLTSPNATNGTVALHFIADAQADATDSFRVINGADGTLKFGNDSAVAGTYVDLTTMESDGDWVFGGTTPYLTIGDAGAEDAGIVFDGHSGGVDWHVSSDDSADDLVIGVGTAPDTTNRMVFDGGSEKVTMGAGTGDADTLLVWNGTAQDYYIALDDSADDLIIGLGSTAGTTPIISMTDAGVTTITGSTDGTLDIYGAGTTASDAKLRLIGDAQADASDSWQLWNDSSAGSLIFGNDSTTPGTYVTKLTLDSAGVMTSALGTVHTSETATALTADTTATITVSPGKQTYTYTIDTDNEDCTLTFSAGGSAGDEATIIFITDAAGSADEVMTFHSTLANTEGTLTLENLASGRYVIKFVSDGTVWNEVSRTAALS